MLSHVCLSPGEQAQGQLTLQHATTRKSTGGFQTAYESYAPK